MPWQNIHPQDKPNWPDLNEGQKRYAVEQYQLARVRRGLPIDHPVPDIHHESQEPNHGAVQQGDPDHIDIEEVINQPTNADIKQLYDRLNKELDKKNAPPMPAAGKRPLSTGEAGSSGAQNMEGASTSRGTGAAKQRRTEAGKTELPGTAEEQASAPMEGGPREVALPNPTAGLHNSVRYYRKVHRFITYGLAYNIIHGQTGEGADALKYANISTPLAKIPWDRLYFYLNEAEYQVLPPASWVEGVSVKVICRNVRIAFPTNSSDSNLATLNQNKDIIIAQGLHKNIPTIDVKYTSFQQNQPMVPIEYSIEKIQDHYDLGIRLYGEYNEPEGGPTIVPCHQMGIPTPLPFYALLPYCTNNNNAEGYPCLQQHYKDVDADTGAGNEIISLHYKPSVGFCRAGNRVVYEGYPGNAVGATNKVTTHSIPRGSHDLLAHRTNINWTGDNKDKPTQLLQEQAKWKIASTFNLYDPIEKSQYLSSGNFATHTIQAQDTLHVGLQPVIALTTTSGDINSYTDSQAYLEIVAECAINTSYPTPWPNVASTCVSERGTVWEADKRPTFLGTSMFNGLYPVL